MSRFITAIAKYDVPMYTNVQYPFPIDNLPAVPEDDNPTGCYRRTFVVPDAWQWRRTFIHFEGVDSAFHLWVNGEMVGYSQESRLPAEFDITDYLRAMVRIPWRCASIAGLTAAIWRTRTSGG